MNSDTKSVHTHSNMYLSLLETELLSPYYVEGPDDVFEDNLSPLTDQSLQRVEVPPATDYFKIEKSFGILENVISGL